MAPAREPSGVVVVAVVNPRNTIPSQTVEEIKDLCFGVGECDEGLARSVDNHEAGTKQTIHAPICRTK